MWNLQNNQVLFAAIFVIMTKLINSVQEVLHQFEDPNIRTLRLNEISSALNQIIPEDRDKIPPEWHFEKVAWDLVSNISGKVDLGSGDFFNNKISLLNSKQYITTEYLNYWEKRALENINPILVRHYTALVIDFSKEVGKKNPSFTVVQLFLSKVLTIVNEGYCKEHADNLHWLKISFKLAIRYNQGKIVEEVLNTILNYEINNGFDKFPGLWGYAIELVKTYGSQVSEDLSQKVMLDMVGRFDRIENSLLQNDVNLHCAERAFDLLSSHFHKRDKSKLRVLFDRYSKMVKQKASSLNIFNHLHEIEKLYKVAKSLGYNEEAKALLIKIRELGPQTLPLFKLLSTSQSFNKELIDELYQFFSIGEKEEIIRSLITIFFPQIQKIKEQMKENQKNYLFKQLMREQVIGNKGIKSATLEPLNENNEEKHLIKDISQSLILSSLNFHIALDAAIFGGGLTVEDIYIYWTKSWYYREDIKGMLKEALNAYFNKNYIVFLSVIVPCIEGVIRNIIEAVGGNVLKVNEDDSQELLTLGTLLRLPEAKKAFGEDVIIYLRTALTEKLGLNIRNSVSHGAFTESDFNRQNADRILHIFLLMSFFRPQNS